jgi:hypothetical protein
MRLLWKWVVAAAAAAVPGSAQMMPSPANPALVDGAGDCGAVSGAGEMRKGETRFPSYLEDSFAQLKAAAPALRGLKFAARAGGDAAGNEDESARILSQTGAAITAMLPRVPHLIAKEQLSQAAVPRPYMVDEGRQGISSGGRRGGGMQGLTSTSSHEVEGEDLQRALQGMLSTNGQHAVFGYRIQSDEDPKFGFVLNEYRTNARDERVDVVSPGSPHGVGFGNSWLMFQPENLKESRFRYLGRQRVGKHETLVVAFAQSPERVGLPGQISIGGKSCRYLMQGVVWIDQSIFQIVRLQTDLEAAIPDIHLTRLRSEVSFSEIRIRERNLSLWMPSIVAISWETKEQAAVELHRYSNYKLFTATSRIVLP